MPAYSLPIQKARPQVEKPEDILAADKLLFPGVGAYEQAMGVIQAKGYTEPLKEYIQVSRCSTQSHCLIRGPLYKRTYHAGWKAILGYLSWAAAAL